MDVPQHASDKIKRSEDDMKEVASMASIRCNNNLKEGREKEKRTFYGCNGPSIITRDPIFLYLYLD
jgi:hypothetical protein